MQSFGVLVSTEVLTGKAGPFWAITLEDSLAVLGRT